jgi:hypothetical protein
MAYSTSAADMAPASSQDELKTKREEAFNAINTLYCQVSKERSRNEALQQENKKLKEDLAVQGVVNQTFSRRVRGLEDDLRVKEREASALRSMHAKEAAKRGSESGSREHLKNLRKLQKSVRGRPKYFKQCLGDDKYNAEYLMRYRWHDCHFERLKKLNGVQTKELDMLLAKCEERLLLGTCTLGQDVNKMLDKNLNEQEALLDLPEIGSSEYHANFPNTLSRGRKSKVPIAPPIAVGGIGEDQTAEKTRAWPNQSYVELIADDTFTEVTVAENGNFKDEATEQTKFVPEEGRSHKKRPTDKEHESAETNFSILKTAVIRKRNWDTLNVANPTHGNGRPFKIFNFYEQKQSTRSNGGADLGTGFAQVREGSGPTRS